MAKIDAGDALTRKAMIMAASAGRKATPIPGSSRGSTAEIHRAMLMPVAPCLPKQESIFLTIITIAIRYQGCARNRLLAFKPLVAGGKEMASVAI